MTPTARCTIPLFLALGTNSLLRLHWAKRGKLRDATLLLMRAQIGQRKEPLSGRPRVVITRHSSKPFDADNGPGGKLALDCLKLGEHGLGWIRDDNVEAIEYEPRWQRAAPKRGQLVVEVYER